MKIIGFTGRAGCGKSTARDALINSQSFNVAALSFAAPLRKMLNVLLPGIEKPDKAAEYAELCGKTYRKALQTLGTDWGRNMIGDNVWVNCALSDPAISDPSLDFVVFDDVRFDNESREILDRGGIVVRIDRPGFQDSSAGTTHQSEQGVSEHLVTLTITNVNSGVEFSAEVIEMVSAYLSRPSDQP